ncbi:MAG TPA: sigma-70 family RNA polymerase sigma factor [Polyangiaceae bacterium]|nr:sigma-70 family RNA polymerase sigma factor [Polyangiaceae bacterium]
MRQTIGPHSEKALGRATCAHHSSDEKIDNDCNTLQPASARGCVARRERRERMVYGPHWLGVFHDKGVRARYPIGSVMSQQPLVSEVRPLEAPTSGENGCIEAFSRELDYIFRTLRRLGVPRGDLEDLAHEVFLVLHRNWNTYDPSRSLRAYLFGIAFRVASSNRRRTWRETAFAVIETHDRSPTPDRALEAKRARALVLAALADIPLARRAVLAMHDLDEIPMRDIARELSIPLFTAYSRLRKARREFEKAVIRLEKEAPGL